MHDLQLVVSSHGGQVTNIKADKLVLPNTDVDFEDYFEEQVVTAERFVTQDFRLSFKADYPSFTTILKALESTAYVIQIDMLDFGKIVDATEKGNPGVDADDLEVALTIKVYALAPAKATN